MVRDRRCPSEHVLLRCLLLDMRGQSCAPPCGDGGGHFLLLPQELWQEQFAACCQVARLAPATRSCARAHANETVSLARAKAALQGICEVAMARWP